MVHMWHTPGKQEARHVGAGLQFCSWYSGVAALPGTSTAPLERASLVLAHPAPHASVLATLKRPGQALGSDGAAMANGFRLGDLQQRGAARPNREEQLRVLVPAGR